MIAFGLKLLLAHLLGDFLLQPDKWIREKRRKLHTSPYLYLHSGIHALVLWTLLRFDTRYLWGIALVFISHFLIDLAKLHLEKRVHSVGLFIGDQVAHLLILVLVYSMYFPLSIPFGALLEPGALLFFTAVLSITWVAAILMRVLMGRWTLQEDNEEDSLPRAGFYIGMLERIFIFVFIVLQEWSAIGWLIAAKSVFRFSDLSRARDRKLTEYVLIGTLVSVGIAVGVGLCYLFLKESIV